MAGAGRRIFQPGEVLTASNTMNYLMDQAVQVFAGTAARGSAIGTAVSEGMVSYLADTNDVEVYTGSVWEGLGPKGRIAQVVPGFTATQVNNSTTSWVDTGLTATITPKFSTSKIVILVSQNGIWRLGGNSSEGAEVQLLRNGTQLALDKAKGNTQVANQYKLGESTSFNVLDTPSSTSALIYKTQFRSYTGTGTVSVQGDSSNSQIILVEVTA